jgi:hypothetical protein
MDGAIVGFVMARADLGDFGRTEPVAVVDTTASSPRPDRGGTVARQVDGQPPESAASAWATRRRMISASGRISVMPPAV